MYQFLAVKFEFLFDSIRTQDFIFTRDSAQSIKEKSARFLFEGWWLPSVIIKIIQLKQFY